MVNEPYEGYDRYVMLDVSFEAANIEQVQVAITGANDDQPAEGNEPLPGIWQVTLGLNQGTQSSDLRFISADVTVDGEVESFLTALSESIGDMSQLRPGRSVGESCGGF